MIGLKNNIVLILIIIASVIRLSAYSQSDVIDHHRENAIKFIKNKNYDAVTEYIRVFVPNRNHREVYNVLMIWEMELMLLFKGKHKELLNSIQYHESAYYGARNNRTYLIGLRFREAPYEYAEQRYRDELNTAILSHLRNQRNTIRKAIENAKDIEPIEKDFLKYYLELNIYYYDRDIPGQLDRVKAAVEHFYGNYIKTEWNDIIYKYSSFKDITSPVSYLASFNPLSSYVYSNPSLTKQLTPILNLANVEVGIGYRGFSITALGGLSMARLKNPLELKAEPKLRGLNGQVTVDYRFDFGTNNRYSISPYIGISGIALQNEWIPNDDISSPINLTIRNRSPIGGIKFDINTLPINRRLSNRKRSYHRIQVGIARLDTPIGTNFGVGNMLHIGYSFGFQTFFNKRKRLL